MVTAVSNFPSFLGYAKETTPGTPVAASIFTPSTTIQTEDVRNYVPDNAMRGSAVDAYLQVPTQGWGTFAYTQPVFMDTIGTPLKGVLGAETVVGSTPFVHTFSVLNSGTYQAPTWTITDYNGFEGRQYPFGVFSQVEFTLSPDALLMASISGTAFASTSVSKPTQTFSAKTALAAYKAAVTIAGSASVLLQSATLTIARNVTPVTALNNSNSPTTIFGGSVAYSGSFTAIFTDDTFLTPMLNGTATALDFSFTNGADILDLHSTSGLFLTAPIQRGSDGYMQIAVTFSGVANTTDVSVAGGGYSPVLATLTNTTATY